MADFSVARFVVGFFELICGLALFGFVAGGIYAVINGEDEMIAICVVGFLASLLLVAICQLVKAQIVTADATQQMLAIMRQNQESK